MKDSLIVLHELAIKIRGGLNNYIGKLFAVIFQQHLKKQYYDFLLNETYKTDHSVLATEESSMNMHMISLVEKGSEIATNEDVYYMVHEALSEKSNVAKRFYLREKLNSLSKYDEKYPATTQELIDEIGKMGYTVNHKTIRDDMDILSKLDINIVTIISRENFFSWGKMF